MRREVMCWRMRPTLPPRFAKARSVGKAMRGRIALLKRSARNVAKSKELASCLASSRLLITDIGEPSP
jgi:hypothetical protein